MEARTTHTQPDGGARQRGDRGASAVEYALLLALITAVIALAVGTVGGQVWTAFTNYIASY